MSPELALTGGARCPKTFPLLRPTGSTVAVERLLRLTPSGIDSPKKLIQVRGWRTTATSYVKSYPRIKGAGSRQGVSASRYPSR
jgi:hypothetical protein